MSGEQRPIEDLEAPLGTKNLTATVALNGEDPPAALESREPPQVPEFVATSTAYELRAELAVGGMGVVYWAWDQLLRRDVAVKLLRPEHRSQQELVDRFISESQIMSRLQHPGIPPVFGCGFCSDGRPYYAMKLVKGVTLRELSKSQQRSRAGLLIAFTQVCQALDYAHSQGVTHLDVKPNNVMIGAFGEVNLMDWGLARCQGRSADAETGTLDASSLLDTSDSIRGTPAYMSPEQARGGRVDSRADIFGLGAILCELLTGLPPYDGTSARQVFRLALKARTGAAFRRLENATLDPRLIRLTMRCLAASPDDRPSTAGEVARELSVYQEALLSRAEDDMQRFFELSLDLFCIAGIDGYFRRVNPNFSRVLGHRDEDLLSRPFVDFVHEDDREGTFRAMNTLARGEPVVRFRNRYQTADGRYVTFEWTAKSFVGEELVFAVARDVTDREAESV